jgi:hypothetical protein
MIIAQTFNASPATNQTMTETAKCISGAVIGQTVEGRVLDTTVAITVSITVSIGCAIAVCNALYTTIANTVMIASSTVRICSTINTSTPGTTDN